MIYDTERHLLDLAPRGACDHPLVSGVLGLARGTRRANAPRRPGRLRRAASSSCKAPVPMQGAVFMRGACVSVWRRNLAAQQYRWEERLCI
jgi:hypothetical protein